MLWQYISVLGAIVTLTSAGPVYQAPCAGKDADKILKVLSKIEGSQFCSGFLNIKTPTHTVTFTSTEHLTSTVTKTSTINVSKKSTNVDAVADKTTVTNSIKVTLPAATTTTTAGTISTDTTVTDVTTSTSTLCLTSPALKRNALPTSNLLKSRVNIPKDLQCYSKEQIYNACRCYLASKPLEVVTKTITTIKEQVKTTTKVTSTTKTNLIIISSTTHYPTTVMISATTTVTPSPIVVTVTHTDITSTSTTVQVIPTTTDMSEPYIQAWTGNGCMILTNDTPLDYANVLEDAEQQCACICNQLEGCQSFIVYQGAGFLFFPGEWYCATSTAAYDSSSLQCNTNAEQGAAYNKFLLG